jgi:hypothetical protein
MSELTKAKLEVLSHDPNSTVQRLARSCLASRAEVQRLKKVIEVMTYEHAWNLAGCECVGCRALGPKRKDKK